MSLSGLIANDFYCKKCGERPTLCGFSGSYYWWCHKCSKEVTK